MLDLTQYIADIDRQLMPWFMALPVVIGALAMFAGVIMFAIALTRRAERISIGVELAGLLVFAVSLTVGNMLTPPRMDPRPVTEVIEKAYGINSLSYDRDDPTVGKTDSELDGFPKTGVYKAVWISSDGEAGRIQHGSLTVIDDKVQLTTDGGKTLKPIERYSVPKGGRNA